MMDFKADNDELERLLANHGVIYDTSNGTVGRGWFPIVDDLVGHLVRLGWDRDLHQVKSKFGTFRFYVGVHTPEMRRRIDDAKNRAQETCSDCCALTASCTACSAPICEKLE